MLQCKMVKCEKGVKQVVWLFKLEETLPHFSKVIVKNMTLTTTQNYSPDSYINSSIQLCVVQDSFSVHALESQGLCTSSGLAEVFPVPRWLLAVGRAI